MHYSPLNRLPEGPQIAAGLRVLQERIGRANIPSSKLDESLNIATWNIRALGGGRSLASLYFIAEILHQFDLVAITELRDDLSDLKRVMEILGERWKVVFSDYITDAQGNLERIAYLYDERMAVPTGLVAEADPPRRLSAEGHPIAAGAGWWRKPYMASFRAGSFDFVMVAAHIRYGDTVSERVAPIEALGDWVMTRRAEPHVIDQDFILLGDFNIPSLRSKTYKVLKEAGLLMPSALAGLTHSTLSAGPSRYDQILHSPTPYSHFSGKGGIVDFFEGDYAALYPDPAMRPSSKEKFTFEMSDHFPLWLQVKTLVAEARLEEIATGEAPGE